MELHPTLEVEHLVQPCRVLGFPYAVGWCGCVLLNLLGVGHLLHRLLQFWRLLNLQARSPAAKASMNHRHRASNLLQPISNVAQYSEVLGVSAAVWRNAVDVVRSFFFLNKRAEDPSHHPLERQGAHGER